MRTSRILLLVAAGGVVGFAIFGVTVYRAVDPFWFFRLKRPAIEYALSGTGLDLDRLQLTAADLERHGPGLVLDQTSANGDRLLVWTE